MENIEYIIVGVVFVILVIGFWIIITNVERRQKKNIIDKLSQLGMLSKSSHKAYDYDFKLNEINYLVKFIFVGNIKELSFNSLRHWQIKDKKKNPMINPKGFELLEGNKVIIVYPAPKQILKYINENEVVFVRSNEKCFDYYVYTDSTINEIKHLEV